MEVLLHKDVPRLGHLGDVVQVADGYARNYLLPQKIAVLVNADNLRLIERARQERIQREQEEMARVNRLAEKLEGFLCCISARATDKGHLFGSVGPQQVADHLAASGFEGIRPSAINLPQHIEEVGDAEVEIMLHPEVRVRIIVRVANEEEETEGEQK